MSTRNTYQRLEAHLEKHEYKKGANKGDAPAMFERRRKTWFLVQKLNDCIGILFHRTHIVKVYPDGRLIIDTDGYFNSQTTKHYLAIALHRFATNWTWDQTPRNLSVLGYRQGVVRGVRFYDGIQFMETPSGWDLMSELKPFSAKRVNKKEVEEFNKGIKESGFKDMFKVLHGTCPNERGEYINTSPYYLQEILTDPEKADSWIKLIQYVGIESGHFRNDTTGSWEFQKRKVEARKLWTRIMRRAKSDMFEVVSTTKYRL
jgi:hypothetical protein